MHRIATRLLLISILSLASLKANGEEPTVSAEFQQDKPWSEDKQLLLELTVVKPAASSFESVVLKLTATNVGSKSIFLDRELSTGVHLDFVTDLEPKEGVFVLPDPRVVDFVDQHEFQKPSEKEASERVVEIAPKKSITRIISFRDPIRFGGMGRVYATDGEGGFFDYETFSEGSARLKFPTMARNITVRVWYERGFGWTPDSVLEEWFGITAKDLGQPWKGRAVSAPLTISLESKDDTEP